MQLWLGDSDSMKADRKGKPSLLLQPLLSSAFSSVLAAQVPWALSRVAGGCLSSPLSLYHSIRSSLGRALGMFLQDRKR